MPLFSKRSSENGKRRKTFFHRLLEGVLLFVLLIISFIFIGNSLCRIALSQIAQITNTKIEVSSVDFKLTGVVLIKGVTIRPNRSQNYDDTILKAEKVYAGFKLTSLLRGRPQLKRIRISNFVIDVQRDLNTNEWNLSYLNLATPKGAGGAIPLIQLKGGIIRYSKVIDNHVKVAMEIPVAMNLAAAADPNNGYEFSVTTAKVRDKTASTLTGFWRPGKFVVSGGIASGNIPTFEKVWTIDLITAQADYSDKKDYSFKLRIKGLQSKENFASDTFGFNKSEVIKQQDSFVALQGFLDEFRPKGTIDVNFDASGNLNKLADSNFSGILYCRDVSIYRTKFPYLVENIKGRIDFTKERVVLDNLVGHHGKVKLFFDGKAENFGENNSYHLQITSNNMALDEDLYDALSNRKQKMWSQFSPTGFAAIDYSIDHPSGGERKDTLKVEMLNAQAKYVVFAYPLRNITGTMLFGDEEVVLSKMVSNYDGHIINVDGKITGMESGKPAFDIRIKAKDVPVDSVLRESFPKENSPLWDRLKQLSEYANGLVWIDGRAWSSDDIANPFFDMKLGINQMELNENLFNLLPASTRKTIADLQPKGKVDILTGMSHLGAEGIKEQAIEIKCRGSSANLGKTPYSLKNVTGSLVVAENSISLKGIEGILAGGIQFDHNEPTLKIDGNVLFDKGVFSKGQFAVYAGNLSLDEQLGNILAKDTRSIYTALSPTGAMDVNLSDVVIYTGRNGSRVIDFDGDLRFKNCSFKIQPVLTSIDSDLKIKGCYDANEGLKDIDGTVTDGRLKIKAKSLAGLKADLRYDSNNKELFVRNIGADCYGGILTGNLDVHDISRPQYSLQIGFEDVNVAEFMSDTNRNSNTSGGATNGTMNGSLGLNGKVGDSNSTVGGCKLIIKDMKVGRLSPITKLLTVIKLKGANDFAFNQMYIDSYIKGNGVFFEKFDLSGEGLAFNGSGWMDLNKYNIELSLMARGPRLATDEPGVIQSLGEGLGYGVVRLEVKGNVYDPQIKTLTLPVLEKTLEIIGTKGNK